MKLARRRYWKRAPVGVTLIECLIVIAIMAVLTDAVFRIFTQSLRLERASSAIEVRTESLSALARTWRNDVHGAERVSLVPSTPSVLIEYRSLDSRGPRVWHLMRGPDKSLTIVREVRNGLGQPQTRQTLGEKLDAVDVLLDDAHQLYSMHIRAHSGTAPFMRSQDLTFLASSHTLPLSPTAPLEVH
jgi:prepilin-type N-terminal cleavage/methylation domain-containing protein